MLPVYYIKAAAFNKHDEYYQFRYFVRDIYYCQTEPTQFGGKKTLCVCT